MCNRIEKSQNPDWTTSFYVDYFQKENGKPTYILIKVFDNQLRYGDYRELASGVFDLESILSSEYKTLVKKGNDGGEIHVSAEMIYDLEFLNLRLSGKSLMNARGPMKKTIPFYQFTRMDFGSRYGSPLIIITSQPLFIHHDSTD